MGSVSEVSGWADAFQAKQVTFLKAGDIEGLLRECYTEDAAFHTFNFKAKGREQIRQVIEHYLTILSHLGERRVEKWVTGPDFIWMEMTISKPEDGSQIKVYEIKFFSEGKISLQLFGVKQGVIWEEGAFAAFSADTDYPVHAFHDRYLAFHARGDASDLADHFYTPDARLITANVDVQGREQLREMFGKLFEKEDGFTPVSVENITGDSRYVWFEATVKSNLGQRSVYDIMLLEGDRVSLQLVGQVQGPLPTEAAFGSGK